MPEFDSLWRIEARIAEALTCLLPGARFGAWGQIKTCPAAVSSRCESGGRAHKKVCVDKFFEKGKMKPVIKIVI